MWIEDLKRNFETLDKGERIAALIENISGLANDKRGILELSHLLNLEFSLTAKRESGSRYLHELGNAKEDIDIRARMNFRSKKLEAESFQRALREFRFVLSCAGD